MSPNVNDELVTDADLIQFKCPSCGNWQKDFIKYQCYECEKEFWYKITLNPDWFPNELEDGSPDWNSVTKDDPKYYPNKWEYKRLKNESADEWEVVPINREGKKWDYLDYQISTAVEDNKIQNTAMQKVNGSKKTAKEIKQEIKLEKDIEKRDIAADKEEKTQVKPIDKKEQNEVMKLIEEDKK